MKNLTPLYVEYDDLMIKKRAYYSNSYFRYGKGENEENALAVIKYAFTDICDGLQKSLPKG